MALGWGPSGRLIGRGRYELTAEAGQVAVTRGPK